MNGGLDPPPLPPGRLVPLPGRGTTFVRELAGPPGAPTVILLHGWTVTADLNWFPSYGPLARRFRVLALDQRGHGRGLRSWRPFRLEDCADDVAALAQVTDTDRAIVIGYSMGGPVAQLVWRRHPELVEGLVLCATSARFVRDPGERLLFASMMGLSVAARRNGLPSEGAGHTLGPLFFRRTRTWPPPLSSATARVPANTRPGRGRSWTRFAIPSRRSSASYPPIVLYPQSTYKICPVTAEASGLHKNTVALATSSGLIGRGSGDRTAAYSTDFSNSPGRMLRAARLA